MRCLTKRGTNLLHAYQEALDGARSHQTNNKPDIDNIMKITADALNGLAYLDNKQIISCTVGKYYSNVQGASENRESELRCPNKKAPWGGLGI
ncbi:RusA family crossover junction endodeoxyribonuclease [Thermosinus carboxydivorans]